jgi:hypothetical protein
VASGPDVYVGGQFTGIGNTPRRGIALIRHVPGDQGEVQRFDPDVPGEVRALALSGNTLYAGGSFDTVNATGVGAVRHNLAAVDATSGDVLPFDPDVGAPVNTLALDGGTVFAGGEFTTVNGTAARERLAALDSQTGAARPWRADADGNVLALALHGRTLFAGGAFGNLGGSALPGVAALDADSAAVADWPPFALEADLVSGGKFPGPEPTVPQVGALATGGSTGLVAGGDFLLTAPELRAIHLGAFRLPPLAPTGVAATAGDGSATVTFDPPADGGSPITSFTVTAAPGGRTATGTAGPLVVDGLENATPHTFTVTATNAVGTGPPSAPSEPVTPRDGVAPELLSFGATRRVFAAARGRTAPDGDATPAGRRRAKRGTKLKLRLSEAARVRFAVLVRKRGRKVGGKCRKPTRANRSRKRCKRLVRVRAFRRAAPAGKSRVAFSGRFGRKPLKRGRYVLRAKPTDAAGNVGNRRSLKLRIVR